MPRNPHCSRYMVQKAGKPTEVAYTSRLEPMTRDGGHDKSQLDHQRHVASWIITVILSQHRAPHNRAPTTGHIDWLAATCHYQWTFAMLTCNSAPWWTVAEKEASTACPKALIVFHENHDVARVLLTSILMMEKLAHPVVGRSSI